MLLTMTKGKTKALFKWDAEKISYIFQQLSPQQFTLMVLTKNSIDTANQVIIFDIRQIKALAYFIQEIY